MKSLFALPWLCVLLLGACSTPAPYAPPSTNGPSAPAAVRILQRDGYGFRFQDDDVALWEAQHTGEGWTLRIYEDGAFGMSGDFGKDYDAQTEALVDFFTALDISPEQASLTNLLTVEAMGNDEGTASGCDRGICCNAQVVNRKLYAWRCRR
jgi:hypothetical protein